MAMGISHCCHSPQIAWAIFQLVIAEAEYVMWQLMQTNFSYTAAKVFRGIFQLVACELRLLAHAIPNSLTEY